MLKISTDIFVAPIRALRDRLAVVEGKNVSQQEMVRRIGCSNGAYRKWEKGKAIPRGDWMLKILALCPDEETRSNFFVDIGENSSRIPSTSNLKLPKEEKEAPASRRALLADGEVTVKHITRSPKGR
jgi:transcriptional regulator with XRE-family HTH domain